MEASAKGWPHEAQVREILERIRQKAEARKVELKSGRSPEDELQGALDWLGPKGELEGWPWISIYAGLGRLHTKAERYAEAASSYRMLLKYQTEDSRG